jgi:hypothetical protein
MENIVYCPILEDCPVYVNNTRHNEIVGLTYRSLYCLQVNKKFKMCKRYDAFVKLGRPVPRYVMPNSPVRIDELKGSAEII